MAKRVKNKTRKRRTYRKKTNRVSNRKRINKKKTVKRKNIMIGGSVEGKIRIGVMNLDLKLLDYLISIYEGPKDLSEDKKIFHSLNIERDINF